MKLPRVVRPAMATLLVALAAPACNLIAGLGPYHLTGTGGAGGATTSSASAGTGGIGGALPGTRLSAGAYHACVVKDFGALRCWGKNQEGELGLSTLTSSLSDTPIPVPGVADARQVAAGAQHTCAILSDDTVTCWGDNSAGAAGATPMGTVVAATPVGIRAAQLAAGADFTCAITTPDDGGKVKCWGNDFDGSLGHAGGATSTPTPTDHAFADATAIATCSACATACAVAAGQVWCWGGTGDLSAPQLLADAQDVKSVAVGASDNPGTIQGDMVFVLSNSGVVNYTRRNAAGTFAPLAQYAMGIDRISVSNHVAALTSLGELAFSDTFDTDQPPPPLPPANAGPAGIVELAAGPYFDCVRTMNDVLCMGIDNWGQLGDGHAQSVVRATQVASGITAMSTGSDCTTLQLASGALQAFGECQVYDDNAAGPRLAPAPVALLGTTITFFRTGPAHGITDAADRRGYFIDSVPKFTELLEGALIGTPDLPVSTSYVDVVLTTDWDISRKGGAVELVALTDNGNDHHLFSATSAPKGSTRTLTGQAGFAAASWAGHVCAWTPLGALSCWGTNDHHQTNPTAVGANDEPAPVPVAVVGTVTSAAAGAYHSCALVSGEVYCWGSNSVQQLGGVTPGSGPGGTSKIPLPPTNPATLLVSGQQFACAYVHDDGAVYCWGRTTVASAAMAPWRTPSRPRSSRGSPAASWWCSSPPATTRCARC